MHIRKCIPGYSLYVIILLNICFFISCAHVAEDEPTPRVHAQTLYLALDGVPYDIVQELYDEGHFQDYQPPSKVISPFPSTSNAGFGSMFHQIGADRPLGYDDIFYSIEKKEMQGSLIGTYPKSQNDYRSYFDYYRGTAWEFFLMYAMPGATGYNDLKRVRHLIWEAPEKNDYFVYIGGTDGAGHILGRKRMKHWLSFMEDYLNRIQYDYRAQFGRDLRIVLFSDHGFHFVRPKAVMRHQVAHALRKERLSLSNNLHEDHRVVAVALGNISGASFYSAEENVAEVSELLADVKGIDLVAYRLGDEFFVYSGRNGTEKAQILYDAATNRYRYQPLHEDPLRYADLQDELRNEGKLDKHGYASDEDWFEKTHSHYYPDALFRIRHALTNLVENPAPILCSTQEDYEFGSSWTRVGAFLHGGLKGTHGGLFHGSSASFVMTNDRDMILPDVTRYTRVLEFFLPNGLNEKN